MDEYPEYDFYNSREECDGKKGRGEERRRGDDKKMGERRPETTLGTGQVGKREETFMRREGKVKKLQHSEEEKDK